MPTQTYKTMLSIEECRSRLCDPKYSPPRFFLSGPLHFPSKGRVFAELYENELTLFAIGPRRIRNAFAPFFYGSLEPVPNGTRIEGRFQMHPLTRLLNTIWFGGVGFIMLVTAVSLLSEEGWSQQPLRLILDTPVMMLLLGIAFVGFGWALGKGQRQIMEDFFREELLAIRKS